MSKKDYDLEKEQQKREFFDRKYGEDIELNGSFIKSSDKEKIIDKDDDIAVKARVLDEIVEKLIALNLVKKEKK